MIRYNVNTHGTDDKKYFDKFYEQERIWLRNLQKTREEKGLTQVRLATEIGISQQSITCYESGVRVPSLEVAYDLAKVLGTTIEYLIGKDE